MRQTQNKYCSVKRVGGGWAVLQNISVINDSKVVKMFQSGDITVKCYA